MPVSGRLNYGHQYKECTELTFYFRLWELNNVYNIDGQIDNICIVQIG